VRPVIVWFRRDLRVDDNPALFHASREGGPVLPLFIFDADLIGRLPSDGAAFDFQAECLNDLRKNIASLGGTLVLRHGTPLEVHKALIETVSPRALFFNRDYDPAATERDTLVRNLWEYHGLEVRSFRDVVQLEPAEVLTDQAAPYVVFTPYSRKWKSIAREAPVGKPDPIRAPVLDPGVILDARGLGRTVSIAEPAARGGETEARAVWRRFRTGRLENYDSDRNFPGTEGTSRLSPYLRFGCIAVSRLVSDLTGQPALPGGSERFLDELIWRDFYISVLSHFPRLKESNYRSEFDHLPWNFDDGLFAAWKEGRTGYPIVDAGMRQLNRTGWMHNRVRMIVASFLTKDLMHDWKLGEKVFEEKLLDIETASNNGGWQWAASTGVDPRPLRIFNPALQAKRFDPEGVYIRTYVPELRGVPPRFLFSPSEMPPTLQKDVGCIIGRNYPAPVVNHKEAAERYKAVFISMKLLDVNPVIRVKEQLPASKRQRR